MTGWADETIISRGGPRRYVSRAARYARQLYHTRRGGGGRLSHPDATRRTVARKVPPKNRTWGQRVQGQGQGDYFYLAGRRFLILHFHFHISPIIFFTLFSNFGKRFIAFCYFPSPILRISQHSSSRPLEHVSDYRRRYNNGIVAVEHQTDVGSPGAHVEEDHFKPLAPKWIHCPSYIFLSRARLIIPESSSPLYGCDIIEIMHCPEFPATNRQRTGNEWQRIFS